MSRAIEVASEMSDLPPVAMRLSRRMRETSQAAFDDAVEAAIELQKEAYASGEPQRLAQDFRNRNRWGSDRLCNSGHWGMTVRDDLPFASAERTS